MLTVSFGRGLYKVQDQVTGMDMREHKTGVTVHTTKRGDSSRFWGGPVTTQRIR